MTIRMHGLFHGLVQGVCFRNFTETIANFLGLSGTVENKPDMVVDVFVEGDKETVDTFLECLSFGPRGARVDEITITPEEPTGKIGKFEAIYPAVTYPKFPGYGSPSLRFGDGQEGGIDVCDICGRVLFSESEIAYINDGAGEWVVCKSHSDLFVGLD